MVKAASAPVVLDPVAQLEALQAHQAKVRSSSREETRLGNRQLRSSSSALAALV